MTDLELQVLSSVNDGRIFRTTDGAYHRKTGATQYVQITHPETAAAVASLEAQGMLTFERAGLNPEWQLVRPNDTGAVVLMANGGESR